MVLPVLRGARPARVVRRTWRDSWVRLRCPSCGRSTDWPQPELGCPCGTVIRVPVDTSAARPAPDRPRRGGGGAAAARPPVPRPPFRPVTIRTGRDAVAAAARYLSWLGFQDVRPSTDRSATGVDVRGRGLVAQVDPATGPTARRSVETLWLNCLNENAAGAFFSLAGYADDARRCADAMGVPLFVMDLTGTPQPVNDAADEMLRTAPGRSAG